MFAQPEPSDNLSLRLNLPLHPDSSYRSNHRRGCARYDATSTPGIAEGQELLGQGEMLSSITKLIEDNKSYAKKIESYKALEGQAVKKIGLIKFNKWVKFILDLLLPDLDSGTIKDVLFQLKNEIPSSAWLVGQRSQGKVTLSIAFSQDLIDKHCFHAGNMVRELAKHIQGGGGGQPFFATAGGKILKDLTRHCRQESIQSPHKY